MWAPQTSLTYFTISLDHDSIYVSVCACVYRACIQCNHHKNVVFTAVDGPTISLNSNRSQLSHNSRDLLFFLFYFFFSHYVLQNERNFIHDSPPSHRLLSLWSPGLLSIVRNDGLYATFLFWFCKPSWNLFLFWLRLQQPLSNLAVWNWAATVRRLYLSFILQCLQ